MLAGHGFEVVLVLAVAATYYGSARVGLVQQLVREQVTPLWPPTGLALAALLVFGVRVWPGVALGAFLVNVTLGPSVLAVLAITAGNTLAPLAALLLLRRAGFRPELDRLRDVLALIFLGALAGMLISSTIGSSALVLSGAVDAGDFWSTWSVWWTGDAMGILVVTPFLLVLRRLRWPVRASPARWLEAGALAVGTVLVTLIATRTEHSSLLFLVSPFLIWAAFRFRLAGAAPCALVVSLLAIVAATSGAGPFDDEDLFATMVTLQAFNGTTALTALLLAALITERNKTHDELSRLCNRFAVMLTQLDPGTDPYETPPEKPPP
ncbi:MASE1 domain-containing protein [Streptomyces sp. NPDC048604]|uniref:MASE1 domain-containing protein n=1 Tax=Streptomyces sp. NPDC048604 TaxID=3365578 RepID=UPI00371B9C02